MEHRDLALLRQQHAHCRCEIAKKIARLDGRTRAFNSRVVLDRPARPAELFPIKREVV